MFLLHRTHHRPPLPLSLQACCTLKSFCALEFGKQEVAFVMNSIIKCLHDREIPVKLAAALALQDWLDLQADVEEFVYPHVPTILRQFFKLFNELGSDEVVGTLSQLCSVLGPRIAPFAVKMVTRCVYVCMCVCLRMCIVAFSSSYL